MNTEFEIDGYGNLIAIFRKMPEDGYRKPVMAAFRKAAVPVKRAIIASLPSYLKGVKTAVKIKPGKGKKLVLAVGVYGNTGVYVNRRGVGWDPYMLVYWHNYGTLSNRAPGHSFQYRRRKKSAHWKGGIRPRFFVDRAVESSIGEAQRIFDEAYLVEHEKFLEKLAVQ
ncbi:MAG: hypothetical protein GT597_13900 [Bacteroidales bacterium]|jgi:hypothetical protein|nr:hypothetical protein [Bacteroidales bacterium]